MTDKPIIIDGVDVSGCKKYEHEIVRCNATLKNMCFCGGRCTDKKNVDCDFKQLKLKEQECEALQMSENKAGEIIAELKAENDTLRQFLSKEPLALQALQSAYSSYKKSADVFYEMVKQYKQTLTEIKEISEILAPMTDEYEDCYDKDRCFECEFTDICKYFNIKQILQKINEVTENEYNTKDIRHINEKNQEYIAKGNRMAK